MKYVITGSLGNISKPLAEQLIKNGHDVTVISSNADKAAAITNLGAKPLIGNIEDATYLTTAFNGADAVYLMIPPKWDVSNWFEHQKKVADNYATAVTAAGIKNVMVLSSVGAHMGKGCGPVDGLAYLESRINELKVNALYLRPSYFYHNILSMIGMIKNMHIMGGNQPADFKMVLVHPKEIATVAAERLLALDFKGKEVVYISSDERTWNDITSVISDEIHEKNIPWVEFTDEQSLNGLLQAGLPETIAKGYTTMGIALRSGEMQADYFRSNPRKGKIKLEDFAKEFAVAFSNQ